MPHEECVIYFAYFGSVRGWRKTCFTTKVCADLALTERPGEYLWHYLSVKCSWHQQGTHKLLEGQVCQILGTIILVETSSSSPAGDGKLCLLHRCWGTTLRVFTVNGTKEVTKAVLDWESRWIWMNFVESNFGFSWGFRISYVEDSKWSLGSSFNS